MAYKRRYGKRRRSGSGHGSAVGDVGAIASAFDPRGALITGVLGFLLFYFLIPVLLTVWVDYNKAQMTGAAASAMGQMLDTVFLRRFINPSEWVGTAILILCVGIACWKAFTRTNMDAGDRRDAGFLAKLLARFVD